MWIAGCGWLTCVETPDLAALVPGLMARYPHFAWRVANEHAQDKVLLVELHPRAQPERVARIEVNPHAEVYFLSFGGHNVGPEFAYEDEDKREVFEDLIKDAVALAAGPTRISRHMVDGIEISSSLLIDPDGPNPRSLGMSLSKPITYVKARLRGRRTTEEIIDVPSINGESG